MALCSAILSPLAALVGLIAAPMLSRLSAVVLADTVLSYATMLKREYARWSSQWPVHRMVHRASFLPFMPALFPPINASWQRVAHNPILTADLAWERVGGHPCVVEPQIIYVAKEKSFRLYYRGGWSVGAIGLAYSADGITSWRKHPTPIFGGNVSVMQPWVVVPETESDTWFLFTSTWDVTHKTSTTNIATSPDGIAWMIKDGASVPLPNGTHLFGNRAVWREPLPAARQPASSAPEPIRSVRWVMLQEAGIPDPWAIYVYTSADGVVWDVAHGGKPLDALQRHPGGMYGGPSIASVNGAPAGRGPDGMYHVWYHAASRAGNLPTDVYHASARSLGGPWSVAPATPVLTHSGGGSWEYDQVADPSPTVVAGFPPMLFYDGDNNVTPQCSIGAALAGTRQLTRGRTR